MAERTISGGMQGGEALQRHLGTIVAQLGDGAAVNVGFLEHATYPMDAESESGAPLPVAQVAFWNEYGTQHSPQRPFIRDMIASKSGRWGNAMGVNLRATNYNAEQTLALMGEGIKDQMVESIVKFKDPPNAASTIARKGFNKPLIDTGTMQRAVDFQVLTGAPDA